MTSTHAGCSRRVDWMRRTRDSTTIPRSDLGFVTGKILRFAERDVVEQAGHDFYTCGLFAPRGLDEKDTGQYDHPEIGPGFRHGQDPPVRGEGCSRAGGP